MWIYLWSISVIILELMYGTFKVNMFLFIGPLKVSLGHTCSSIIATINCFFYNTGNTQSTLVSTDIPSAIASNSRRDYLKTITGIYFDIWRLE